MSIAFEASWQWAAFSFQHPAYNVVLLANPPQIPGAHKQLRRDSSGCEDSVVCEGSISTHCEIFDKWDVKDQRMTRCLH
ncbi:hypothetical protein B9Z55_010826 [Caenorhabditis nigoni]|nr:hypothetical protein B9Z55_010826 [Caenorhabditis nigoni]